MDTNTIEIRDYQPDDARPLMELFHATVHTVCSADYTPEQLAVWSPVSGLDVDRWCSRFARKKPFVAVVDHRPVGFIELDPDGHIDCLYVDRELQRRGIGARLLDHLVAEARRTGIGRLFAEVSLTAVAFFTRQGFSVVRQQEVERNGQRLRNVVMERRLPDRMMGAPE